MNNWMSPYGLSIVYVLIAAAIRFALDPWISLQVPFLTFFFAVMIATWRGGLGPGLLASALSALVAQFLFIEPAYELTLQKVQVEIIPVVIFVLETTIITLVSDKRKRTEEALRRSEARFRTIFQQTVAGMAETDLTGHFIQVNQFFCQMVGRTPQELYELRMQDITHPDDISCDHPPFQALVEGTGQPFVIEKRYMCPDGTAVWVSNSVSLVRDQDGQAKSIVAISFNITDQKQSEEALRQNELKEHLRAEEMRTILEAAPAGIWIAYDRQCLSVTGNRLSYEMLGLPQGTNQSKSAPEPERPTHFRFVYPDGREYEPSELPLQRAAATGLPQRAERLEVRFDDGPQKFLYGHSEPLFDAEGKPRGAITALVDVTEMVQAEKALQEQSTQLEHLVEVRTAELQQSQARLRALATDLNLAGQRERQRLAGELHEHLAQLLVVGRFKLVQAQRLAGVIPHCADLIAQAEEVLNTSLTYTRTLAADLCPPVLHEFGLQGALQWLANQMRRQDMVVAVELADEEDLGLSEDQAVLLFQSVRELLMNASKHAATGEAWVKLFRANGNLHIQVRDEGVGFESVEANGINSSPPKFGLFSIRERMKALGGVLDIQSSPGVGTTATMRIPLTIREGTASRMDASVESETVKLGGLSRPSVWDSSACNASATLRVLLVDDHAMVRQGLRSVLETYSDIEVIGEASDGHQAVLSAEELQPSVIVMDINMPKMNGIEATRYIKQETPDVIVIGLSVNADENNQQAMRDAGAAMLLTKEAAVEQLYSAIQQAVTSKISERTKTVT